MQVTIKAGISLLAADRGGTSDPYVVVGQPGGQKFTTKTIRKTVNPVWEQSFEKYVEVGELYDKPIRFEVFDDDKLSKDDSIGTTVLNKETIGAIVDQGLSGELPTQGVELWLPLSTQGHIGINVKVDTSNKQVPEWGQLALKHCEPLVKPALALRNLPTLLMRNYSHATVNVTVVSGKKLPAADLSATGTLRGDGGTSDPYVVMVLAKQKAKSKVMQKTLNPEWNQTFKFKGLVHEFLNMPLEIEVGVLDGPRDPQRHCIPTYDTTHPAWHTACLWPLRSSTTTT